MAENKTPPNYEPGIDRDNSKDGPGQGEYPKSGQDASDYARKVK